MSEPETREGVVPPPRYELAACLGRGGGGEVWAVRDRSTLRTVALKVLRAGAAESEVLALVREATALSGLEGLGVPRVLRFGRLGDGRPYLVRELVAGVSLAELVGQPEASPTALLTAVAEVADQLTLLHRALLLHGDVKPANVIVSEQGPATLVDLGLSAALREGGARALGLTPRYAAPELLAGGPLTVRAEVYSLGATLRDVLEACAARLDDATRGAIGEVVTRALARAAEQRFPSADELASALRLAASLPEPAARGGSLGQTWPIVELDERAAALGRRIEALDDGRGLVLLGPRGSGRSTLLRRMAWGLGARGAKIAWLSAEEIPTQPPSTEAPARGEGERKPTSPPLEALRLELAAYPSPRGVTLLVDDAAHLAPDVALAVEEAAAAGARLVLVVDPDGQMPVRTSTLDVVTQAPLEHARELVRRVAPSLPEAVVSHVLARSGSLPGPLRALLTKLEGRAVVSPDDVDALASPPRGGVADVHALLDRGRFEEAAEALAALPDDGTPSLAIARSRLFTNRGEPVLALLALLAVEHAVASDPDPLVRARWHLHAARAHLRKGDYARAEEHASAVPSSLARAEQRPRSDREPLEELEHAEHMEREARALEAEAAAVEGLALSYEGELERADGRLRESVASARALGDDRVLALALGSLGFGLQKADRLDEARVAYDEARAAAERAGDAGSVATTRLNLASIAKTQGDLGNAISHLEAAVDMGRRSGRVATLRQALSNLANLELYLGRLARARVSIDALAAERAALAPHQRAQLLALEAEHAQRAGDLEAAATLCGECAEVYEQLGRAIDAAEAHLERALALAWQSDVPDRDVATAIERARALLAGGSAHRALLALAEARLAMRTPTQDGARERLDLALSAARAAGQRDLVWRALEARASLEQQAGASVTAARDREEAVAVLEEIAAPLPRDLREVYWSDPRRAALRAAHSSRRSDASASSLVTRAPTEDRLSRILEVNRAIAGETSLPRLLERVTDHAIALVRAERGFVLLRSGTSSSSSEPRGEPSSDLSVHAAGGDVGSDPHTRFSRSIAQEVLSTGAPVVTSSAASDERMAGYVSVHQLMLQSVACVPIRARSGLTIGALYLETRLRPAQSFEGELPTLLAFADQVAIAIETARLLGENERRRVELEATNGELERARARLEELLGHRTAQLKATRRDLRSARAVLKSHFGYQGLVGTSEAMRRVYSLIERIQDTDVPVLLTGESGTGKEMIARAIHHAGPRDKRPFLGLNCGAIPEHLLESELFGHVRGAFTGADRDRRGLFREATGGTLLLDEIGEMPHKMQAGLLRVLQEKLVRPVGSSREEPVDTRVIAATHRDLGRMVAAGTFREDLFYRLNVISIRVPSLRERLDDIPLLVDHFLGIFAARYGRDRRSVSREAQRLLVSHPWPGNVRQLENCLLNAWVLSDAPELEPEDFDLPDPSLRAPSARLDEQAPTSETSLAEHKSRERERILAALADCNWNRVKAAELVGLPRRTFYRRLKEYGIQ